MTQAVFKYPLGQDRTRITTMPWGATVLTAQMQRGYLQLWALVDTEATQVTVRTFGVYGTGDPVPQGARYVATVQAHGGLVWHVFELSN